MSSSHVLPAQKAPLAQPTLRFRTRWKARFVEDLKAKFLGQVRDGVFTPSEDVYAD